MDVEFCQRLSLHLLRWFLSFNLLMWCITLIDLQILKNPCIPEIKPTRSWCMIFLNVVGFSLLEFCWGFLHLCSSVILACSFLWHKERNIDQWNKIESPEINPHTYGHLVFDKGARIYNGLKTISLTSGAGKTGQPLVKERN